MTVKPRSLFGRLMLGHAIIAIAIAATSPILMSNLLRRTADQFVAARVHRDAARLAETVYYDNGWHIAERVERSGRRLRPPVARSFVLIDAAGRRVAADEQAFPLRLAAVARRSTEHHLHIGHVEVSSLPIQRGSRRAWLITAQDRRPSERMVDDVITSFLSRFIWLVPATILLSFLLAGFVTRFTTRAIARVAKQADGIAGERLDLRLDAETLPTEVRPLAGAANRALDRIYEAYEQQSRFAADVAHELRTPLSTLAFRTSTIEDAELRAHLLRPIEQASHVIDQLLELARLQNDVSERQPIDLGALAEQTVAEMAPAVFRGGRAIELHRADDIAATALACEGLVRIALTNLIDNAARHTPLGTTIVVTPGPAGSLSVEDDGPGIAPPDEAGAPGRYRRADARRSDSAGLGLSIVARIMATLQGGLDIGARPGGGARFVLSFPQPGTTGSSA